MQLASLVLFPCASVYLALSRLTDRYLTRTSNSYYITNHSASRRNHDISEVCPFPSNPVPQVQPFVNIDHHLLPTQTAPSISVVVPVVRNGLAIHAIYTHI